MPVAADHESLLRLLHGGAPASALRRLLDTHGGAAAAVAAGPRDWASHGLGAGACNAIRHPDAATLGRSLHWLEDDGHHLLGWGDDGYPPLLRRIASPPAILFVAGDPGLLWRPAVAVVGSRAATAGGRANGAQFATALARAGLCVASGLAAGIDAAAHAATLEAGGATVAVLGTGPDVAYPVRNRPLMARIEAEGALVSEHPPGTGPLRAHFPSRNRILAGLALGTLVIEAALQSGALITARLAAEAGREVFVLPGSIHNPMARGCHRLLRDGAALVETPDEVVEALAPVALELARALRGVLETSAAVPSPIGTPPLVEDSDTHRLWQALGHDPTTMDELVERSGLTAAAVSSMLLALELEGRIAAEHGRYSRIGG
ncbi:DNA-protecting protein DprA [Thermomonas brevis]|uniref:DNA-protecting protein DprA n=1 Tax=Thermomonas brevis TaxID=215691 RepID=A0A7G9QXE6_9GAMM|nr:DNA-processing protein DprA [Thermomonas brevis]QNN48021.1 DNA-protecting protein DprA [Thermomonas brevis]